jgi:hypothetical protein
VKADSFLVDFSEQAEYNYYVVFFDTLSIHIS